MRTHLTIFAWMNIIFGAVTFLTGLGIWLVFGGLGGLATRLGSEGAFLTPLLGWLGNIVLVIVSLLGLPGIIAGIGLLRGASWARSLGLLVAALNLPAFPVGTAIGAYGLWILNDPETVASLGAQAAERDIEQPVMAGFEPPLRRAEPTRRL